MAELDATKAGAAALINAQLAEWGIAGLAGDVTRLLSEGWDPSALMTQLEQSASYKERFKANDERRKKGLKVLSPGEYVATETQMKSVLRSFGMPPGFYDSNDDITKFLANDVSPSELQERAQVAQQVWMLGPQENRTWWKEHYGLGDGAAIAAILDPNRALGLVQKQAAAAQLGGTAQRQGLKVDTGRAEQLAGYGVSADQALEGFGQIAESLVADQGIAKRFGSSITQTEEEDARLLGLASSRRKLKGLQASEAALFSGGGAAGGGALSGSGSGQY